MPFPPNYRQERSNRERAKQRSALDKQARRDEKSATRKSGLPDDQTAEQAAEPADVVPSSDNTETSKDN